jgi:alcohol dehydrogenase (cytochrome c)
MAVDAPVETPRMAVALQEVSTLGRTASSGSAAGNGQQVFTQYCAGCHGKSGEGGGGGPSLKTASGASDLAAIIAFVKNPKQPMPKLYPSPLSDSAVAAVSQYVLTLRH